jgi:hypothetical protein
MVKAPKRRKGLPCETFEGLGFIRIPRTFCEEAECEFLDDDTNFCDKYVEQARVRHKPKAFIPQHALRTPSDGKRGFYGKKDIRTGGFA